jgi:RNA polymerase-interacting CarD/CdnL/TRCF family regulator
MFKINDSVIHCREGLSVIVGSRDMNGKEYFLVSVKHNSGETIYVPVDTASSIIRPLMDKKAADSLLSFIKKIEKEFNTNTKQRRDAYKRRLSSGDVKDIAYLYKQLYFYNLIGGENNTEIKLGPVDIDMLSYAENMLLDELSITYSIPREDIKAFVEKKIC